MISATKTCREGGGGAPFIQLNHDMATVNCSSMSVSAAQEGGVEAAPVPHGHAGLKAARPRTGDGSAAGHMW